MAQQRSVFLRLSQRPGGLEPPPGDRSSGDAQPSHKPNEVDESEDDFCRSGRFTDSLAQPLDPGAVTKRFRALVLGAVEELSLPYITLHGLRHSFATTVLGWGVEPFKVSRILGQANISITLDLYNEYLPSRDNELRGMFPDQHLAL